MKSSYKNTYSAPITPIENDTTDSNINKSSTIIYTNTKSGSDVSLSSNIEDEENTFERLKREILQQHSKLNFFQRPSIYIVALLIFLFGLSEMLFLIPFISITMKKICTDLNLETCDSKEVQINLSSISSLSSLSTGIITTLIAGKWGEWSDRYGRVKMFGYIGIIRLFGNLLHLFCLSSLIPFNKWLIIGSSCIGAISGEMYTFFGNVNTYITDIAEAEERISHLSIASIMMQLTMGFAPLLGSTLVKTYDGNDMVPIYVGIISFLIYIVLCFTIIIEPRHHEALKLSQLKFMKRQESIKNSFNDEIMISSGILFRLHRHGKYHLNQLAKILSPLKKLWLDDRPVRIRINVILLVTINILFICATLAIMPSLILYGTYKYHWKTKELGYFISMSGFLGSMVLFIESHYIIPLLKRTNIFDCFPNKIDSLDKAVLLFATSCVTIGIFIPIFFNKISISILYFLIFRSLGKICTPVFESTLMKYYAEDNKSTGQVFGAIAILNSFSMLILPPLTLKAYGLTVAYKPEFFLYVPLTCSVLSSFCIMFLHDGPSERNDISMGEQQERDQEEHASEGTPVLQGNRELSHGSITS